MRNRFLNEITALEKGLTITNCEILRVDAVIEDTETELLDAAQFRRAGSLEQKQRLQRLLFPQGIEDSVANFRTNTRCLSNTGIKSKSIDDNEPAWG